MRRGHFFIVALAALGTYAALSSFTGRRHWMWERRWSEHYCHSYFPSDSSHRSREYPPQPAAGRPAPTDSANLH